MSTKKASKAKTPKGKATPQSDGAVNFMDLVGKEPERFVLFGRELVTRPLNINESLEWGATNLLTEQIASLTKSLNARIVSIPRTDFTAEELMEGLSREQADELVLTLRNGALPVRK